MGGRHEVFEQPVLTIPFYLRDYPGSVAVYYGVNQNPQHWGFHLFGREGAAGYPICQAIIDFAGPGYYAFMGWLQLVSIQEAEAEHATIFLDTWPNLFDADVPFAEFGYLPTLFDAPSPDPALDDQTWQAESFLVVCPDVFFSRKIIEVVGFRWGYTIEQAKPTIRPVEVLPQARWNQHLSFLRKRLPSWEFLSS